MDAYVFLETEPGSALNVMNELVDSGVAARAVAVTGQYDVIARIENLDLDDLVVVVGERLGGIAGIRRSSTAVVAPTDRMSIVLPPLPFRKWPELPWVAIQLVRFEAGRLRDGLARLAELGEDAIPGIAVITGEYDAIIELADESFDRIAERVLGEIHAIDGIASTSTALVVSSAGRDASS